MVVLLVQERGGVGAGWGMGKATVGDRGDGQQHRRTFTPMLTDPPEGSDERMFSAESRSSRKSTNSALVKTSVFNSSFSTYTTEGTSMDLSTSLSSLSSSSSGGESMDGALWNDATSMQCDASSQRITCSAGAEADDKVVATSSSSRASSRRGQKWAIILSSLRSCRSQSNMQQAVGDFTSFWSPDCSHHGGESLSRFCCSPVPAVDFHMLQCTGVDDTDTVEQRAQMFGMHIQSYSLFENVLRAGADVSMRWSGAPKKRSSSHQDESLVTLFMEGSTPQELRLCWCKPGKAKLVGNSKTSILFADIQNVRVRSHAGGNRKVTINAGLVPSSHAIQFQVENDFQGDVLRLGFVSLTKHLSSIGAVGSL
jgi:hypothetical protein